MLADEVIRRRTLPHWDMPHAAYFVTTCLAGSIPAQGRLDLDGYRRTLSTHRKPAGHTDETWKVACWKLMFARADDWLDSKPAVRLLENSNLANAVMDALYHFAGYRYDLLAFVVMPSHIHWVFQPREEWVRSLPTNQRKQTPRERICHSINRYTAERCNSLRGTAGTFWQHESYDHWIRDVEEMERILRYVEANPIKAGLAAVPEDWLFSSAHQRYKAGLAFGTPLTRSK